MKVKVGGFMSLGWVDEFRIIAKMAIFEWMMKLGLSTNVTTPRKYELFLGY